MVFTNFRDAYSDRWLVAGDPAVQDFEGSYLVYVAAGPDPFDVITNAVKYGF